MEPIVKVGTFSSMGDELGQVKNVLKQYAETKTVISYHGNEIEASVLLQFYEYLMALNRTKLRKCQQKGIEEALKRKSEGNGNYGRPKTSLPRDFDDQVRSCLSRNESLSNYCDKIGMKKSTFYKYAKKIQEGMETNTEAVKEIKT